MRESEREWVGRMNNASSGSKGCFVCAVHTLRSGILFTCIYIYG